MSEYDETYRMVAEELDEECDRIGEWEELLGDEASDELL